MPRIHHEEHEGHEEWRPMSRYLPCTPGKLPSEIKCFVLLFLRVLMSFVVRQLCASVRVLAFDHFSLVTDLEWQEKHSFTNRLVR